MAAVLFSVWKKLGLSKKIQIGLMRAVNDKFLIGVTGVIFNDKQEVLLVKHTYRRVEWSLPGGYLQSREHPKKGLAREIFEETGFTVQIERILKTQHDGSTPRLDMSYIGKFVKGSFKKSDEVIDYGFFSRKNVPPLIDDQYKQIDLAYKRYAGIYGNFLLSRFTSLFKTS